MKKPNGYWTYEHCYEAAQECTTIKEFSTCYVSAYIKSVQKGWRKDYTWLQRSVTIDTISPIYLIYAYEDPDNKVCYIGLTKNLVKRKSAHKKREYYKDKQGNKHLYWDSVAKYFISFNKPIPEPIILEEHLNAEQAQIQENYWKNEYISKGWTTLNVAKTGKNSSSLGGCERKWNLSTLTELAKLCKNKEEMKHKHNHAYKTAKSLNIINQLFPYSIEPIPNEIWKDIPEYEGVYQISNFGRVKHLIDSHHTSERQISIFTKRNHQSVSLYKNNKQKIHKLSILLLTTFGITIPQPNQ